jgi:uncharacterized protein YjbI with pentapeptide repeats
MLHTSPYREEECQVEPEKTPRERANDLISLLVSDWRPTPRQGLWAIRVSIVIGLLVAIGYPYDVTVWDWIKLLVVPATIAIGVAIISWMQNARQRQSEEAQREREQQMEDLQRQRELEVAHQSAMDSALETYLDKMERSMDYSGVLATGELQSSKAIPLIRARTLTLLERLDGSRKRAVMRFLSETSMIQIAGGYLDLQDADFSDADLTRMNLSDQNLLGIRLAKAKLTNANLCGADLRAANLSGAILSGALLGLAGTKFHLPGEVDAEPAQTNLAKLNEADLSHANLEGAIGWTLEQLSSVKSLEGATMPNGQKYEDWLKSRDRKEDGENE